MKRCLDHCILRRLLYSCRPSGAIRSFFDRTEADSGSIAEMDRKKLLMTVAAACGLPLTAAAATLGEPLADIGTALLVLMGTIALIVTRRLQKG
jgi:hypothetical protein